MVTAPARQDAERTTRHAPLANARAVVRLAAHALLDLCYPPLCAVCRSPAPDFRPGELRGVCSACRAEILWSGPSCPRCATPLDEKLDALPGARLPARNCPECRTRKHRFDAAVALGNYEGTLRQVVLRMKKAAFEPLTLAMGDLVASRLAAAGRPIDFLAPVPIHWLRSTVRGTNTTEVLVEAIRATLGREGWRVRPAKLLAVRRNTKKQGTLAPAERKKNVRGAFQLASGYDLTGKHIVLVDDVLTTGATLDEAAWVLKKKARAAQVTVAVVARGTGNFSS